MMVHGAPGTIWPALMRIGRDKDDPMRIVADQIGADVVARDRGSLFGRPTHRRLAAGHWRYPSGVRLTRSAWRHSSGTLLPARPRSAPSSAVCVVETPQCPLVIPSTVSAAPRYNIPSAGICCAMASSSFALVG